jgi:hypothetical protein
MKNYLKNNHYHIIKYFFYTGQYSMSIDKLLYSIVAWHGNAKWRHHEDTGKKKEEKCVDIAKRKKGF